MKLAAKHQHQNSRLSRNFLSAAVVTGLLLSGLFLRAFGDEAWLIGKWKLIYDPDEVKTDWLEFLPGGDVYNIWNDGTRVPGIYIIGQESVKAVFTYNDKDLIATFHYDKEKQLLKIVTSASGKESIYQKQDAEN
jgi:hypothetical protein